MKIASNMSPERNEVKLNGSC